MEDSQLRMETDMSVSLRTCPPSNVQAVATNKMLIRGYIQVEGESRHRTERRYKS